MNSLNEYAECLESFSREVVMTYLAKSHKITEACDQATTMNVPGAAIPPDDEEEHFILPSQSPSSSEDKEEEKAHTPYMKNFTTRTRQ